jgi:PmbA protein
MSKTPTLTEIGADAVALAKKKGAQDACAHVYREREVSLDWRDGKLEKIHEATTRGVSLRLFVDGRYASGFTSDLRPEALATFVAESIAVARTLAKDPARGLAEPALYAGRAALDLKIHDGRYAAVTPERRLGLAGEIEAAARSVPGHEAIVSVTTQVSDTLSETALVTSNGFSGFRADTQFWAGAQVSAKDPDGRKPQESTFMGKRFVAELPPSSEMGTSAARRALSRIGAKKADSAILPMVLDNRAGGRLVNSLFQALRGGALQQKQSFLEGQLGQEFGSSRLDVADDPLLEKGLGSRLFDGEGITAKRMPVFAGGVLKSYYLDTYYARKLKMAPTTAGLSNLAWTPGGKAQVELLADIQDGILVTNFLGGNSNGGTGDFSFGVAGFRIRDGMKSEPVAEMNVSGNHLEVWKRLVAVGNDAYEYSSLRTPTLVFDGVQFAGN